MKRVVPAEGVEGLVVLRGMEEGPVVLTAVEEEMAATAEELLMPFLVRYL